MSDSIAQPRVVVADDSGLMRRLLSTALRDAGLDVVAVAADGDEALAACEQQRPDAMTLDLAMPGMDGIGVLRELAKPGRPATPVVVVSAFSPAHGARAVDALAEGAFDLVAKPTARDAFTAFAADLADKVRLAAASPARGRAAAPSAGAAGGRGTPAANGVRPGAPSTAGGAGRSAARRHTPSASARLVVIAASTGGPRALAGLLPRLPERLGRGTLVIQHMPPGFTGSLAQRLDRASRLTVREAAGGEALDPGTALMAPGGLHLRLGRDRRVQLVETPAVGGLRPRADLTIADAARLYGERLLLVVLTGMGKDGLEGAREVRRAGGRVLVEAASTCAVYGMPRAIAEADLAHAVLAIQDLPEAIAAEAGT